MSSLELQDRIVAALHKVMRAEELHSRRMVDECWLTGPQLATLRETARSGPVASTVLGRGVHLSVPAVTGIVDRLERRGLVRRSRGDADRRTALVSITEKGTELLARAPSSLHDRFRRALSRLAEWERLTMLSDLQRIASMLGAEALEKESLVPGAAEPEPTRSPGVGVRCPHRG